MERKRGKERETQRDCGKRNRKAVPVTAWLLICFWKARRPLHGPKTPYAPSMEVLHQSEPFGWQNLMSDMTATGD